jgi:hypothetical protein
LICALSLFAVAQKKNSQFQFHIQKTAGPIIVDGSIDPLGNREKLPAVSSWSSPWTRAGLL